MAARKMPLTTNPSPVPVVAQPKQKAETRPRLFWVGEGDTRRPVSAVSFHFNTRRPESRTGGLDSMEMRYLVMKARV